VTEAEVQDPGYWSRQVLSPVEFAAGVAALRGRWPEAVLLEVGPGQVLGQLVRGAAVGEGPVLVRTLGGPKDGGAADEWLARALAGLWCAGVEVDWAQAARHQRRLKVALPSYPFQRQRYWVEAGRPAPGEASARGLHKQPDIARWFYAPTWRPSIVPAAAPADARPRRWLALTASDGPGAALADGLHALGAEVVRAVPGERYACHDDQRYSVPPSSRAGLDALFADLATGERLPDAVLFALDLDAAPADDPGAVDESYFRLLDLVQAYAAHAANRPWRLEVITRGVLDAPGPDPLIPSRAALLGLCRVIPQELAGVTCRVIDPGDGGADTADLLAELASAPSMPEVAYRSGERWVRDYEALRVPTADGLAAPSAGGVYLITGGLGQVGLALAAELARAPGARLVLTARGGLPERAAWDDPAAAWRGDPRQVARVATVRALEAAGAEVLVAPADVADEAAMRALVAEAEGRFGPITGVVHAAGVTSGPGFQGLLKLDREACNGLFEAKLRGVRVLEKVLRGRRVDPCLLISSLSTVLGGLGHGAYAAANACLDAFAAEAARGRGLPWRCVNWDAWLREDGPPAEGSALARLAMSVGEGVETFRRIRASRGVRRVVVSTADLEARLAQFVLRPAPDAEGDAPEVASQGEYERPESAAAYVAPRTETEVQIAAVWRQLLGIREVGVHDNFLALGGHSLLAIQLAERIRSRMQVEVMLEDVFRGPTIAELATRVENLRWAKGLEAGVLAAGDGRESDEI
jgi:acyl transferase domain-containing protein